MLGGRRLHRHRRRLRHRRPAARRGQLVPGQRPPDRQGVVHLPRHGARRASRWSPTATSSTCDRHGAWTTWTWHARDPMASYLATVDVGEFDLDAYRDGGIRYLDAIDPDLFDPLAAPSTGTQFALSQAADSSYKRLMHDDRRPGRRRDRRLHDDPRHRGRLGLRLRRGAHGRSGRLDDAARRERAHRPRTPATRASPGRTCTRSSPTHYLTVDQDAEHVRPTGATGEWWAASGGSDGPEQWQVDLTPYAGSTVELSISYASDDIVQLQRRLRRRRRGLHGRGLDVVREPGSTAGPVPGRRRGAPATRTTGSSGRRRRPPPPTVRSSTASFARQPEIIGFLAGVFGPYPWRSAGGIVDDIEGLGFALETQTRPIYATGLLHRPALRRRRGGPRARPPVVRRQPGRASGGATSGSTRGSRRTPSGCGPEREGLGTAQENFDFFYNDFIPRRRPVVADHHRRPRARPAVRVPGLLPRRHDPAPAAAGRRRRRTSSGSSATWAQSQRRRQRDDARSSSGWPSGSPAQQLDELFEAWLYTPGQAGPARGRPLGAVGGRHAARRPLDVGQREAGGRGAALILPATALELPQVAAGVEPSWLSVSKPLFIPQATACDRVVTSIFS